MARVLFFGKLADLAGLRERSMTIGATTVSNLIDAIGDDDPALAAALSEQSVRVVINESFADRSASVSDDDEVAFLPPVSGG